MSFGQWQKLALARGFMRDEPLVLVLDEPTAALDAETEHALFERYAAGVRGEAADGRITILVSHRFSTVRMADLIVVLDGARVVEVGSHADLMAQRRPVRRALRHPGRRLPLSEYVRHPARGRLRGSARTGRGGSTGGIHVRTYHSSAPRSSRSPVLLAARTVVTARSRRSAGADGPGAGAPWVVSLGDSAISGEAGRWAGNTNNGSNLIDAGGADAYWDNAGRTGRADPRLPPLGVGRHPHRWRRSAR